MAAEIVRPAVFSDLDRLAELGKQAIQSGAHTRLGFDKQSFESFALAIMAKSISEVLVVEKDGVVCGGIGMFLVPLYFNSKKWVAQEVFLWVDEGANGAGHNLVRYAEKWAKDRGAAELMVMLNNNTDRSARGEKYLLASGYQLVESNYARPL